MCRLLTVSRATFYAWRAREVSEREKRNIELTEHIRVIHAESGRSYGAPRVHRALRTECQARGEPAPSRKRVAGLMSKAEIAGITRRRAKRPKTTQQDHRAKAAPDLVERDFTASAPNQLWVADITYVPTLSGFLFLAIIMDVFSRRIVGWSMATHLRTELVLDALNMAVKNRRPHRVIHHSDKGCQCSATAFSRRCSQTGVVPSTGTAGDCFDNAMAESFFASLECELLIPSSFRNPAEAALAVFQYIEGWYNTRRLHSALDYRSLVDFEAKNLLQPQPESSSLSMEMG